LIPDIMAPIPRSLRVVVYFAQNPEEALTAEDAATKFAIPVADVPAALRVVVRKGLLDYQPLFEGRERPKVYRAGNVLLCMIGAVPKETMMAAVMQACAPLLRGEESGFYEVTIR